MQVQSEFDSNFMTSIRRLIGVGLAEDTALKWTDSINQTFVTTNIGKITS